MALARSHSAYGHRLTDRVFSQLCEQGFAIVPEYLPAAQRDQMSAALRKILPPLVRQPNPPLSRRHHLSAWDAATHLCFSPARIGRMNFWASSVRCPAR